MPLKDIFAAVSIVLTFVAFIPYIRSVRTGETIPHVFSWFIWGLSTLIVFLAQMADGGGIGAWCMGLSGILTFYIAWMAWRRASRIAITRSDWTFFILAILSIPLWYFTHSPFWAVVILTTVDTLGFGPTFRKAYHKPYEEQLFLYVIMTVRNLVSIPALEHYSWTTIFFPAVLSVTCALFIAMTLMRRAVIPKKP